MISFNVRGLSEVNKRRQIFNYIKKHKVDIALLQETHSSSRTSNSWHNKWGGNILYSHRATNSRGVAILFKHGKNFKIKRVDRDEAGRIIIIEVEIEDNKNITISNIYAPNEDNPKFFLSLMTRLGLTDFFPAQSS